MDLYTTDQIPEHLAKRSFRAQIMKIGPNGQAPLWGLSGLAKAVKMRDIVHAYWTKTMQFPKTNLTAAIDDSAGAAGDTTTFPVASSAYFKPGSVIRIRIPGGGTFDPPEIVLVTAINSSTEIEVERAFADSTPILTIPDDTELVEIGNAYEQGSLRPVSRAILPVREINNPQIFRDGWDVTGTLSAIQMEVGDGAVAENKQDGMFFHAQSIEKASWFGYQSIGTKNGKPITTMDGVEATMVKHSPNRIFEAGATTTYEQLENMVNGGFDFTTDMMRGNTRTIFCGGTARTVINNIGRLSGDYQLVDDMTSFGLRFSRFRTSRGDFELVEHPLFNTNEDWKKAAFVMDLTALDFPTLRDTFHKEYSHDGTDAMGGVYTTELSFELRNPFACTIIYDLTAAAA